MFGAGWTEMLIIGVVALIVIGPKDLPIVMRKLGRVVATVRRMGTEFQREISKTTGFDEIVDLRRSITEPLRQTSEEIAREFNRQTATGVEPSGAILPTDPKVESVYDAIQAQSAPTPPPVMKPLASAEPLPAPAEASVMPDAAPPVKAKRVAKPKMAAEPAKAESAKPRAAKAVAAPVPAAAAVTTTAPKQRARAAAKTVAAAAPAAEKPAPRSRAKKA